MNEPIEKELEIKKVVPNPDFMCTITEAYFDEVIKTPCNHYFEKEAFLRWELEQKNDNGPDTIASCPNCRESVPQYEEDAEMKAKVDAFLYNNISQLPLRYIPEGISKRFLLLLKNPETDRSETLKIFSDHPHLIFYCTKEISMIKIIFSLPIDYLKAIFSELEKIPHLAEFALTWLNPSKNTGIFYSFSVGDIEKFEYIKSFVKDGQLYYSIVNSLEAAATTLNEQFYNHILMFLGDRAKNLISKQICNYGMNTLMSVCYRGTQGMVESILALFKDDSEETIMNLVSSSRYPDIFHLIMLNNSSQSQANIFAIYKSMDAFLKQKLGPDFKLFKEFMTNKRHQSTSSFLTQSIKTQEQRILTLSQKIENLNTRPPHAYPVFFQQAPAPAPISPTTNSTQTATSQNSETTPTPVAPATNASNAPPIVIGPIPVSTVHTQGNEDEDEEVHVGCKQQ